MNTKQEAARHGGPSNNTLAHIIAPAGDIAHRCLECGAVACVTTASAIVEGRYTSRDLAEAYALGAQHERERAAAAEYEHTSAWVQAGQRVSQLRRADLLRQFEADARAVAESMGRPYVPFQGQQTARPAHLKAVAA